MAKKSKRAQSPSTEARVVDSSANRAKMRALVISALAAGGVFQMNSWQIQAHGNRSSHSSPTLDIITISPDDYVLLRQTLTGPRTADTDALAKLSAQLRTLSAAGNQAMMAESYQKLLSQKRDLEKKLGIPSTTRQVIQFLRQGDTDGAIAAIEGQGWLERVLQDYQWTLLDIAYLDDGYGQKFTPEQQKDFLAIAKPAVSYGKKVLDITKGSALTPPELASKDRVAEILHNIASFIVLNENADADALQFGQQASELALHVRTELNQPATISRANWMVAQYHIRANRTDEALNYLNTALRQAQRLNDRPGIAWIKYSTAIALRQSKPQGPRATRLIQKNNSQAAMLEADVRQTVSQFKGSDTTIDFLRIELQKSAGR
jgi:hypothetical protein